MKIDKDLNYTKNHQWIMETDSSTVRIGISDYLQKELGEIVFLNLSLVEDIVSDDEVYGDIESVNDVADLLSPVEGKIIAVNEEVISNPSLINEDPYESWLIEVELTGDIIAMDSDEYKEYLTEL